MVCNGAGELSERDRLRLCVWSGFRKYIFEKNWCSKGTTLVP